LLTTYPAYFLRVCLQAAGWILGRTANLGNLRYYIQDKRGISYDAEITPSHVEMMEGFDKFMPPSYYDLQSLEHRSFTGRSCCKWLDPSAQSRGLFGRVLSHL